MRKFSRYFSIGQFAQVYKQIQHDTAYIGKDDDGNVIRDWTKPLPTLEFTGSEKLHGTNAAIGFCKTGDLWCQSRERILSLKNDNAGFCSWVYNNHELTDRLRFEISSYLEDEPYDNFIVYGEWCGSNIQPQVALSKLPKQFVIFGIKVRLGNEEEWLEDEVVKDLMTGLLHTVFDYSRWTITIDFNHPQESINKMIEITNEVEAHSPLGLSQGVSGIGEGVVWKHGEYVFKVKGRLHSASHVKELIPVDIEKVRSIGEFTDVVVSENRLRQGLDYLREFNIPLDNKAIGPFINWIKNDCIKEESERMDASNLKVEDVVKEISFKAKEFFINEVLRK